MEAKLFKSEQHCYHQLKTTQAYLIIETYTPLHTVSLLQL